MYGIKVPAAHLSYIVTSKLVVW